MQIWTFSTVSYVVHTRLFPSENHFQVPEWCEANLLTILTIQKNNLKRQFLLKEGH
jgi:hypothetical protein